MQAMEALMWGACGSVRNMHHGGEQRKLQLRGARQAASAFVAVAALVGGCSNNNAGNDNATNDEPIFNVGVNGPGTCLDFPLDQQAEVKNLPVIDCMEPHSHEIFAVMNYVDSEGVDVYPGFDALETFARAACLNEFDGYFGISAFDSELFYSWIVPTLDSWDQPGDEDDDREILCVAGNQNGAPLVGKQVGLGR